MSHKIFESYRTVGVLAVAMILLTVVGQGALARAVGAPTPPSTEISDATPRVSPQPSQLEAELNPILLPALAGDEGAQLAVNWPGVDGTTVTVRSSSGEILLENEPLEAGVNLFSLPQFRDHGSGVLIDVNDATGRVVESATAKRELQVDDESFDWESTFTGPGIQDGVESMVVWDDGTGNALYVGGPFTTAGEVGANRIARWDGQEWTALGEGLTRDSGRPTVRALTVYQGDLIAGGYFETAGGVEVNNVARWDGEEWSALGTGVTGSVGVESLAVVNGELFAGGRFTDAGEVPVNRVARWDGATWSPLTGSQGTGTDGTVYSLIEYEGDLVAGGNFTMAGGIAMDGIARWDGSEWSPMGDGLGDWRSYGVLDLIIYEGELIAGGDFTLSGSTAVNGIAAWNDGSWTALGLGVGGGAGPRVHDMVEYQGELVAGGSFPEAGGKTVNYIARWDGSEWHTLEGPAGVGASNGVGAVSVYQGKLFAGSNAFIAAGGLIVNHLATWDGTQWAPVGSSTGLNWQVLDMVVFEGELIAAGTFSTAGGDRVFGIASWDGVRWKPLSGSLGTGFDASAFAVTVYQGDLIVGGGFQYAGALPVNGIARWDGNEWSALASGGARGVDGVVRTLTEIDGDLIVGGQFTTAGGVAANNIARWDGTEWGALGDGVDDDVLALSEYQGDLVPAGSFDNSGSVVLNNVGRWDGTQWSPLSGASGTGADSTVQALTVYQGALIVGGNFDSAGGVTVNGVARWDGTEWTPLTGSGGTGVSGRVVSLHVFGDSLIVGGQLMAEAGGITVNGIARWDGMEWSPLSGPDGIGISTASGLARVASLATYDADAAGPLPAKLLVGGSFNKTGGVANWYLGTYGPVEPLANLTALPGDVMFGELLVGEESQSEEVLLASTGNTAVTVDDITIPSEPFDVSTENCPQTPFTLEPGETCSLGVSFAPAEVGEFEGELALSGDGAPVTVAASGIAVPQPPSISTESERLTLEATAGNASQPISPFPTREWPISPGRSSILDSTSKAVRTK
ncbi:MAG: choice-of-anchor D domain-containing protein [Acidimicrobiia bacterium]|nr:choice-of-anchor D domain-containing protein [Acidimicrobiia bacterium]